MQLSLVAEPEDLHRRIVIMMCALYMSDRRKII